MKGLKSFDIPFVGLKEGSHLFEYQINNEFFETFQFHEFNSSSVKATVNFIKKTTLIELNFNVSGSVNVPCDVTNEPFNQPVKGDFSLIVKFGFEYNDDDDEVLIIPHEEYKINVAQYIYELIVLSVPAKRVHPNVLNGTMKNDTLKKLKELEIKENKSAENNSTDPRWDKLKDLLTEKNT